MPQEIYTDLFSKIVVQVPKILGNDGKHMLVVSHLARGAKVVKYQGTQDHFEKHTDSSEAIEVDGGRYTSHMTILVYLNDVGYYVGGQTKLYLGTAEGETTKETIQPNQGNGVVFFHQVPHKACPLKHDDRVKYILKSRLFY